MAVLMTAGSIVRLSFLLHHGLCLRGTATAMLGAMLEPIRDVVLIAGISRGHR